MSFDNFMRHRLGQLVLLSQLRQASGQAAAVASLPRHHVPSTAKAEAPSVQPQLGTHLPPSDLDLARLTVQASNVPSVPYLKTRLSYELNPPSSSSKTVKPDPSAVLATVRLFLHPEREAELDSFLANVAAVLSQTSPSRLDDRTSQSASSLDTGVGEPTVLDILVHCWIRSAINSPRGGSRRYTDGYAVADYLAQYIIRESSGRDLEEITRNWTAFEAGLKVFNESGKGQKLPPSLTAAWAVLRNAAMNVGPAISGIKLPPTGQVERYLESQGIAKEEREVILRGLSKNASDVTPITAAALEHEYSNVTDLQDHLKRLAQRGEGPALVAAWVKFKKALSESTSGSDDDTRAVYSSENRTAVLSAFLRSFLLCRRNDPDLDVEKYSTEIQQQLSGALPMPIFHALLAHRARLTDDEENESSDFDIQPLDSTTNRERISGSAKAVALKNLHDTWAKAEQKDLKAYLLYMEGLGRLGDVEGLQVAWNALVGDKRCKELYQSEHPESKVFPPTYALNLMISSALLIPKTGPPLALELFAQASRPDSSTPCNLVTINTVLRHYARLADIPLMTSLFNLAKELKLQPDIITYTTLVQGLLRAGRLDLTKSVLNTMSQQGLDPNERMCSMFVSDLAQGGDRTGLTRAEEMLAEMRRRRMKVGMITWTGLISGYFRGGWEKDGWNAVQRMNAAGLKLDRVGYNIILRQAGGLDSSRGKRGAKGVSSTSGGGVGGRETESWGMGVFRQMIRDGVRPNSDTYTIVLGAMVRSGRWDEADKVIQEMQRQGYKVEKGNLRSLINKIKARKR